MARTDNLTNFLTDVADSIREKKGTTEPILASNFDTEIAGISTGITPTGKLDITTNGVHDVTNYASANVNVSGSAITKGLVINSTNSNGFVTDASIVGMETIPAYYMYDVGKRSDNVFSKCTNFNISEGTIIINSNAFYNSMYITFKNLPSTLKEINDFAFYNCHKASFSELPAGLTTIGKSGLNSCMAMKIKSVPAGVIRIEERVFASCVGLTELTFLGDLTYIAPYAFQYAQNLIKLVFPNVTTVPTLSNINAFDNTPIASGTGYIYVPDALVESFKSATNWSTYANQIKGVSELV